MRPRNALLAALLVSSTAVATPYNPPPPFVPLYTTYNATITDNLYTGNYAEAFSAPGYSGLSVFGYVERSQQPGTLPLLRFWKGTPQREHIYLTEAYPDEIQYVLDNGYTLEGIVGYVYTQQTPGAVLPLYRMAKFNANNGDLVHKFVTSTSELNTLKGEGWTYDHVAAYLPRTTVGGTGTPPVNGYPYMANGLVMMRRCGTSSSNHCTNQAPPTWEPGYRNNYYGYHQVAATSKPLGATTQTMDFDLWTPDYFGSGEHLDFSLHGTHNFVSSNIETSTRDGLGIMIGQTVANQCGSAGAQVEVFWVGGGQNSSTCPSRTEDLRNNTKYRFSIRVSDNATISYSIARYNAAGTGTTVVISETLNAANIYAKNGQVFPAKTGYWILPATLSTRDYTVYISNLRVGWQ